MKNIIFIILSGLIANQALAKNNVPITFFECMGFNPETEMYWQIKGESQNESWKASQYFNISISYIRNKRPVFVVTRQALATQYDDSFRLEFYKNDDSLRANTEGVLTVENIQFFPVKSRFIAHGWLAANPEISSSALDFSCELN